MPRKKKVEEPKKIPWYDIRPLYDKGADITVAFGGRSNGKTYSTLKVCLEEFRDFGFKFVYLRRWKDDVNTFACGTLFKQELVNEVFGEQYEIDYYRSTFRLIKHDIDDETGKDNIEKTDIGYACAVSDSKHRKGTNFPNVHIVYFDEFIDLSGENILANEYNKYENIISTIKRTNKIRIIMTANTVSKYSEYFTKLGINPDKIEQGEIKDYLHPNGKAKVICQWTPFIKEIAELAGDMTNSQMISTGQWEIPPTDEIPSAENEHVKERLLFTAYLEKTDASVGVYLRYGTWTTHEVIHGITTPVEHEREFLVIRRIDNNKKSKYFHLTSEKSLKNHYYHRLDLMLKDILDLTEIDVKRELLMGRVFCDNMFTGDIFNEVWQYYNVISVRKLL